MSAKQLEGHLSWNKQTRCSREVLNLNLSLPARGSKEFCFKVSKFIFHEFSKEEEEKKL
jgi:hypothetical protein